MIELKAELFKKRKEYEQSKKMGNRKLTINKSRSVKSITSEITPEFVQLTNNKNKKSLSEEDAQRSRDALEAKARLYNQLEKGRMLESDLSTGQRENLLVDFAWKGWNPETEDFDFSNSNSSSSDDEDKEVHEKQKLGIDQVLEMAEAAGNESLDRWIEYEDEFGRTRVSKLSQLRKIQSEKQEIAKLIQNRNDTNDKLESLGSHYNGNAEIRNKGVGFYTFARDEIERKRQMQELRKLREETVEKRMRTLLMKEQRRIRIESRLIRLKERKSKVEEV